MHQHTDTHTVFYLMLLDTKLVAKVIILHAEGQMANYSLVVLKVQ